MDVVICLDKTVFMSRPLNPTIPIGAPLVFAAVWLIWSSLGDSYAAWIHRVFGWGLVSICAMQLLAGWLRGSKGGPTEIVTNGSVHGDHYDMTPRRLAFEYFHKSLGYFAILLGWSTSFLGMWIVNGPTWMFVVLTIWFVVFIVLFTVLQKRGLALGTYQAIWSPDSDLPGNRRKPIGVGVIRKER